MAIIKPANSDTLFPTPGLPINAENGQMDPVWNRFFYGLYNRSGGSLNILVADLQLQQVGIANVANTALSSSTFALTTAQVAESEAASAATSATSAQNSANAALANQGNFLAKSQNLSDVSNASSARQNLHVNTFPISFFYDSCSTSFTRNYAVIQGYTIQANFVGSYIFGGVAAHSAASFLINRIRGGVGANIGSIVLMPAGNASYSGPGATLQYGDTLQVVSPSDATLAQVGLTIAALIN